jgi:endoglucanase
MVRRFAAVLVVLVAQLPLTAQHPISPAGKRVQHLQHGINASEWFAQSGNYSPQQLRSFTTLDDVARMSRMGFDHVRLSIDPAIFSSCSAPWSQCATVQVLDEMVAKALALDLAVIIDVHPNGEYKRQLATSDNAVEQFTILWSRIAAYYAKTDPERLFLEILNEPEMTDHFRWAGIEQRVVAEIRRNAPNHTIIVAGARYSDIDDLIQLPSLADDNLIFTFHYYEPHIFTHQGASWGEPFWMSLRDVPFPASANDVQGVINQQSDELARWKLTQYGLDHWDQAHVEGDIHFIGEWASRRHLPLICDEFGAYRNFTNPDDRQRWLATVRQALEQNHIGWTMWDYQGGFGVVRKKDGAVTEDEGVLGALGLRSHP